MYQKLMDFQKGKLWGLANKINEIVLDITCVLVVVAIFASVVARYVFKTDIFGIEEIILLISWWLYFFGSMNGSMEDSHIKADLIEVFVKNKVIVYRIKAFSKFIELVCFGVFGKLAIDLIITNYIKMPKTTGLKIPFIVAQFPIALGYVVMAIFALYYCLLFFSESNELKKEGK